MADPAVQQAREEQRTSGLRERDPQAYRQRAFELSVAGYFRNFRDAAKLTPFRVTARTQDAVWESLGEYDLRDSLRQTPHPAPRTLIVHGTFDPIPIAGSRELATLLNASLVELPTGHCPHVEATDDFVRALDPFLPRK
jgi:proline iminopeptidase